MSRAYNKRYKKGKWFSSSKARLADMSKTGNVTEDYNKWRNDPRKYDYAGVDTRIEGERVFKYGARSQLKSGRKEGRENIRHRIYYYKRGTLKGEKRGISISYTPRITRNDMSNMRRHHSYKEIGAIKRKNIRERSVRRTYLGRR